MGWGEDAMEMGELASAAVIADVQHDESCYFCQSKAPPAELENELADNADEDSDLDGSLEVGPFKNNAAKLGKAIGGPQGRKSLTLADLKGGKSLEASVAAHHLIPGNAALKKSELFQSGEYLWKDGKVNGNIAYNVNASPNGVWLPGNYAARPWGVGGNAFTVEFGPQPAQYAFAAIDAWQAQFHDSHEPYSRFVRQALDKVYDKLTAQQELWCPEAKQKEQAPDKRTPLFVLVSRLNTISLRMRRMLVFPTSNWKRNIYTSEFSLAYMGRPQVPGTLQR
jgi:hypothetical protein